MGISISTNLLMVLTIIFALMNIRVVQAERDAKWELKVLARTIKNGSNEDDSTDILGIGQSQPKTLNAGKTLTLLCFFRLGLTDPNSVRWFKDGVELDFSSDPRMAISRANKNISAVLGKGMQQELTLRITKTMVADSGRYMCKDSNENNSTVTITVKALMPPKLSFQSNSTRFVSDSITVRDGEDSSVQLRCHLLQGNPKPRFSWFKDSKLVHPRENWLITPSCAHLKEGIYFFTNGSKQDVIICGSSIKYDKFSGRYTCRAENEKGIDEVHVDLNILAAATIQEPKKKHTRLVVQFGKAVHQTCRASGNPPPKVEWRKIQDKDSVLMSSGLGNETVSLSLHSVSEDDVGNYSCIAQNGHIDQMFVQISLDYTTVTSGPESGNSYIIGIVIGCVAAVLLIAVIAFYVATRRHRTMRKRYLNSENVTLRYVPPLQAKELSRGDSKDMIVVCSRPETDFTPSYCDTFQEEDATTREISEFLARKKETKARASILDQAA